MTFARPIAVWPVALLLAGCAGLRQVSFTQVRALPSVQPGYAQTDDLYVVIDARSLAERSAAVLTFSSDELGAIAALELGRDLSRAFGAAHGRVTAVRILPPADGTEDVPQLLRPTAVLTVTTRQLRTTSEKSASRQVTEQRDGKKATRTIDTWRFIRDAQGDITLASYPAGTILLKKTVAARAEASCDDCNGALPEESDRALLSRTLEALARETAAAVRPVQTVTCARPLVLQKEVPLSKEAADAAAHGRWDDARQKWTDRLAQDPSDWKAAFGLGLAAEHAGDFDGARVWYGRAQGLSPASREAKRIDFSGMIASLNTDGLLPVPPAPADAWFGKRLAVLPFSDEVVSLDGPDFVRQSVQDQLTGGGYNTIPLKDIDEVLKEHGFSDGGQLVAVKPATLAQWLNADRLVFGNVDTFDDQNVGVYRNRAVGGELKIWDAARRDYIWTSARPVSTKILSRNAAAGLVGGLFESWVERGRGKPLAPEVARFTVMNVGTLPLRFADRR